MTKTDDIQLFYEVRGKGLPVILISGYTCDHSFWHTVGSALAEKFQVIVFDNRGVGRTKDNGRSFSIETMAEDTAELIKRLGLSRPAIVGQSMGSAIAQALLARCPNACGRYVMVNATQRFNAVAIMALERLLALRKAETDFDRLVDASLLWLNGSEWLSRKENIIEFKAAIKSNSYPQSIVDQERQLTALKLFDARPLNRNWDVPGLVISAIEDVLCPPREGRILAKNLGADFVEIPGGHASPVEQPQRLVNVLAEFLEQKE